MIRKVLRQRNGYTYILLNYINALARAITENKDENETQKEETVVMKITANKTFE